MVLAVFVNVCTVAFLMVDNSFWKGERCLAFGCVEQPVFTSVADVWYLIDEKRRWPPLERISTFEYMNLDGSKAAPGFPGFVMHMCVLFYVCICVRTLKMSQSTIYFSFSRATTCRVDLLVWKEMWRIVSLDAVYHSLTSFYFPFMYWFVAADTLAHPLETMLYVKLASFVNVSAALRQHMVCWNLHSPIIIKWHYEVTVWRLLTHCTIN